jgi:hypothetical protein
MHVSSVRDCPDDFSPTAIANDMYDLTMPTATSQNGLPAGRQAGLRSGLLMCSKAAAEAKVSVAPETNMVTPTTT